jgi:hypothetical protein
MFMTGNRQPLICILFAIGLAIWGGAAFAQDADDDFGVSESDIETDGDGSEGTTACLRDSDCGDNQSCRDDGRCVTLQCETDTDCIFADFYCRDDDKTCAPKICVWDSDCLAHELCLKAACVADPSTYVEGGVGGCQMSLIASKWDQIGILIIGVLLLGWLSYVRRKRT